MFFIVRLSLSCILRKPIQNIKLKNASGKIRFINIFYIKNVLKMILLSTPYPQKNNKKFTKYELFTEKIFVILLLLS